MMSRECDIANCDGKAVVKCPDCDLNVCVKHSRGGKCIYCTSQGIKLNKNLDAISRILL